MTIALESCLLCCEVYILYLAPTVGGGRGQIIFLGYDMLHRIYFLPLVLCGFLTPLLGSSGAYAADPWNGLYAGLNVGYAFGGDGDQTGNVAMPPPATSQHWSVWKNSGSGSFDDVSVGGQLGYNWRLTPSFVFGVETDLLGNSMDSVSNLVGAMALGNNASNQYVDVESRTTVEWSGALRARLGFLAPERNMIFYVTGGLAYGGVENSVKAVMINVSAPSTLSGGGHSSDDLKVGWTIGGGVEWAPSSLNQWSIKAEYLYTDLGSVSTGVSGYTTTGPYFNCCGFAGRNESSVNWHAIRVGLNWHFN